MDDKSHNLPQNIKKYQMIFRILKISQKILKEIIMNNHLQSIHLKFYFFFNKIIKK